ncbi:hypothetical protein, partial [Luteimonas lutimaris]|uniref:hypothetical protein n=1 Tax=Luteimonas lutimaris TaxID=698645 RepID=UPI0031D96A1D
ALVGAAEAAILSPAKASRLPPLLPSDLFEGRESGVGKTQDCHPERSEGSDYCLARTVKQIPRCARDDMFSPEKGIGDVLFASFQS